MQTVVEPAPFIRDAKSTGLSEKEREDIVDFIARNPEAVDEIKGTAVLAKYGLQEKEKARAAVTEL
jgi:hypothetical protein